METQSREGVKVREFPEQRERMYDKQKETTMELAPSNSMPTLKSDEPDSERTPALSSSLFVDDKNTPKKEIISVLSSTNQKELSGPVDFLQRNSLSSNSCVSASPSPIQDCIPSRAGGLAADAQRRLVKTGASAWNPERSLEPEIRNSQHIEVSNAVPTAKNLIAPLNSEVTQRALGQAEKIMMKQKEPYSSKRSVCANRDVVEKG